VSQLCGLALFLLPEADQFCIGGLRVGSGPGGSGTIRDNDPGKTLFGFVQAGGDSGKSQDFKVIGMSADS
jgi:hypothetical protein